MAGWIARLTKDAQISRLWSFCALCWSPQGGRLSNDFEAAVFRRHPRLGSYSRGLCSSEELRKRRWRVAVRRCLEYSETQRRRAEPPGSFRKTRSSFARRFRAGRMPALCGVAESDRELSAREKRFRSCDRGNRAVDRLDRRKIQDFYGQRVPAARAAHLRLSGRGAGRRQAGPLQRRRDLFPDSGKRPRRGRFRGAAVLPIRWTGTCWNCC